jgi:hypothetical protein
MVESFWAIPDVTAVRTPLGILREQASALTGQTKGVLVGVVDFKREGETLEIGLSVLVPALNDYQYRILIYEQPITIFPGWFRGPDDILKRLDDEDEFTDEIKAALSSAKVKNVLTSLLSQAVDA